MTLLLCVSAPPRPLCRHCKSMPAVKPRGLCYRCYYQPAIRRQYPSRVKCTWELYPRGTVVPPYRAGQRCRWCHGLMNGSPGPVCRHCLDVEALLPLVDPTAPCPHPPGSVAKVAWLRARAELRLPLFHPLYA